jgi:raffinose synthase
MCHSSENILNFRESSLARVSDDFYPTNRASHTVHVANVAYNSVFMGEIVVPDWDMFQSHCGEAGALHAAARAVGGCPVYVSDAPGKHDFTLLRKLVFPSGRVLRGSLPGRTDARLRVCRSVFG